MKQRINSMHLIGYLDEVIIPLNLMLPKTGWYVKKFKNKEK